MRIRILCRVTLSAIIDRISFRMAASSTRNALQCHCREEGDTKKTKKNKKHQTYRYIIL